MGFLYFMADVSRFLHNYRIAVFPERNLDQSQPNGTLRPQMRAWQGLAIKRSGSRLVSFPLPSAGVYAAPPAMPGPYVHAGIYGPKLARFLGWSISVLVHACLLAAIVLSNLYMSPLRAIPQKEPFRWEVSLMAAPTVEAVVADGVESQETAPLAEIDPGDMAEARPVEQVEAYSSHQNESVIQEMPPPAVSPSQQADQERVFEKSRRKVHDLKSVAAVPVMRSSESVLPPPEVEHQRDSDRLQVETQPESLTVLQRPQVHTKQMISHVTLPDYGWLMDALRTKLERVKVYPASAKAGHVQGRVVVQVSIYGDGHIANPEIEESSGSPVLDQAAIDALQAASPLTLNHRLDGPPIVMLIPLNYQLVE